MLPPSRRLLLGGALALPFLPRRSVAATAVNGVVIGRDGWLFTQGDAMGVVDPLRVRGTAGVLKQAVSALRAAKVETVISIAPSRARVYRDMLPEGLTPSASAERRLTQAREELRGLNVLAPDLYAPFARQRAAQPDQPLFFKGDTHWTSYGAELAAGEVARAFRSTYRLPPSSRPGAVLNPPGEATHVTDLAAQLPVAERGKFPPQPFPVREDVAGGLLDDDTSDTSVVGNSFMHPRYGFSRALSFALERPVALHWQIHGNGPYRTMLNYLNGDGYKANKPALLVWHLLEQDLEMGPERRDLWRDNAMPAEAFLSGVRQAVGA